MPESDPSTSLGMPVTPFESLVQQIAFESFGVRIGVSADDPRLWPQIAELIPPYAGPCAADTVDHHFSITSDDRDRYTVRYDVRDGVPALPMEAASWVTTKVDLPLALGLVGTHLHGTVAFRAPGWIFIHGGVVAYHGRAILMPAAALTGKSTLVAALLRNGATYYSDQFAVVDELGRVHPYETSLGLPGADSTALNGAQSQTSDKEALTAGAVVLTTYRPGAEWNPRRRSKAECVLAMIGQTVPAQERPDDSMRVLHRLLDYNPVVLQSERDEAEPLAASLLAQLEREFSTSA